MLKAEEASIAKIRPFLIVQYLITIPQMVGVVVYGHATPRSPVVKLSKTPVLTAEEAFIAIVQPSSIVQYQKTNQDGVEVSMVAIIPL